MDHIAQGGQKRGGIPWTWSERQLLAVPSGCWEPNPVSVQEQAEFLSHEPPLQVENSFLGIVTGKEGHSG